MFMRLRLIYWIISGLKKLWSLIKMTTRKSFSQQQKEICDAAKNDYALACTLEIDGCNHCLESVGEIQEYQKTVKTLNANEFCNLTPIISALDDSFADVLLIKTDTPLKVKVNELEFGLTLVPSPAFQLLIDDSFTPSFHTHIQTSGGAAPTTVVNTLTLNVIPGNKILPGPFQMQINWSEAGVPKVAEDDGNGNIVGDNGTGSINYQTGLLTFTTTVPIDVDGAGKTVQGANLHISVRYTEAFYAYSFDVKDFLNIRATITNLEIKAFDSKANVEVHLIRLKS